MRRAIQTGKSALLFALLAVSLLSPLALTSPQHALAACSSGAQCLTKPPTANCKSLNSCDIITKYVNPLINFLSALVGVGVVISIIIGGIQYSSSEGDPGKASAAKNRIRNAIIALITFIMLYAMLNFLVPGGLV